jgi:hypothetical protein
LCLGRSVASADFDNDGDLDLAIGHLDRPFVLLKNNTPVTSRPFLGLRLNTPNRIGPAGGRIVLQTSQRRIVWAIASGGSYLAAADPRLLLAWPETEELVEIEVHWPSGKVDHWKNLRLNQYWHLIEGKDPLP